MNQAGLQLLALLSLTSGAVLAFVVYLRVRAQQAAHASPEVRDAAALWRVLVRPVAVHLRPTNQAELEILTTTLQNAGRRSRNAVDRHSEERVLGMLTGMVGALLFSFVGGLFGLLLAMLALLAGIMGPTKFLAIRAAERREAVAQALPAAIDLMTTCVDAGLSLGHTIARVGQELRISSPVLAEEFNITSSELDAGVSTPDALRRLARRVGLDDLSALCSVIAQASGLGAPVGNTLREFAHSSRRKRMSILEESAGKLAAQLTIPLAVCLLPAAMMVILGPAVVQLIEALQ